MTIKQKNEYNESNIDVLEGLEAVRKRPGMYIGNTGEKGLHHLVWEIVDNSIDEVLAGYASEVKITINADNSIEVTDNGRGIPVGIHQKTNRPAVETIMTVLHAGGKFGGGGYKVSGGLHGVGASVVNALSKKLVVEVSREGNIYEQEFQFGKPVNDLTIIGQTEQTGTKVTFWVDETIFQETTEYKETIIKSRAKELAFLNKGLKIQLTDQRADKNNEVEEFYYEGGISEYVKIINESKHPLFKNVIAFEKSKNEIIVDVAFQYNEGYRENLYSYVNNIVTNEGGTHEEGFKTALTRTINSYGKKKNLIKSESLIGEDSREGLVAILSIKHPNPQFEGQTKTKLGNSDARSAVSEAMGEEFERFLLENPEIAKKIIEKGLAAQRGRVAAKKARELTRKQSALESSSLPGKLSDCATKDPTISEIYIVEGDSAGGSAKQGRDRSFQAILPLRGKVINVEKANIRKVLENEEIRAMITAIGAGIGDEFNIEKIRYGKIIIMTDADVDGAHIRTLLLTFLYRQMRPLIENGNIFIAQPPLFKISFGKKIEYAYSEEQKEAIIQSEFPGQKVSIQRYKGLGEMNPEQLWDTTMDPEVRTLIKISNDDAMIADEMFETLMGDEVAPRKSFIVKNAKYVKEIDA